MSKLTPTEIEAKAKAKELLSYFEGSCLHDSFGRSQGVYCDDFKPIAKVFANKLCDENIEALNSVRGMGKIHKVKLWKMIKNNIEDE